MVQGEVREVTADLTFAETTRYQVLIRNVLGSHVAAEDILCCLIAFEGLFFSHRLIKLQTLLTIFSDDFTHTNDPCHMFFELERMQHEFPFLESFPGKTFQAS